jgi:hypothetical protein
MLMIAERTLSGLAHPQKIEEMSKELTKVIEDFDRAINVEALRLAKEQAKESSKDSLISFFDNIFSIDSCRIRPARPFA